MAKKTICKSECIVADSTDSIKLVLWESIIDKVNAGNSYKFQNVTIRLKGSLIPTKTLSLLKFPSYLMSTWKSKNSKTT